MSSITKYITRFLLLLAILIPCQSWSQSGLLAIGQIDEIGSKHIIITDSKFKMSPTVKVILINKKPGQLNDLKKGDFVKLTLFKINNVKYVDTINILSEL